MTATVQSIFPPRLLAEQPAAGECAAVPSLAAHPLQTTLLEKVADAGERLIHAFVEALDPAVQALLAESRNAMETRAVLDLGQALSMNRPALVRGFMAALRNRFDPLRQSVAGGIFDLQRLCVLPAEEMEENIALTELAQLAEQKAGEDGRQVLTHLQWVARDLALPALVEALSPKALPECFAQAFRQAGLATAERVLAYRLVESHGLQGWPTLLQAALQMFDEQGLHMARPLAASAAQDAAPMISTATLLTLSAARTSVASEPDAALASALLRAIEPPAADSGAGLITALAAAWLDALLVEPELPPAFASDLESLRLAVIKAALCDSGFFSHASHPVRKAVDELAQQAAFTGLQGYSLAALRATLKETLGQINIHGQFALDALAMLAPVDAELAHQFRQQMARDKELRRENLLQRVRALAAREVDARTLDVSLPPVARAALTRGFLPLLATVLLRHGSASPPTRQARQLLERFVDSFALCADGEERRAVVKALGHTLQEAGLPDLHISRVCEELEKAYAELEEEALANVQHSDSLGVSQEINDILASAGSMPGLTLSRAESIAAAAGNDSGSDSADSNPVAGLLKVSRWFRVRDYKRGDDRWLALTGIDMAQDRVSFSGFDGVTALAMRASQFVQDLSSGLAEPLNPEPSVQQALHRLRARPGAATAQVQSFG